MVQVSDAASIRDIPFRRSLCGNSRVAHGEIAKLPATSARWLFLFSTRHILPGNAYVRVVPHLHGMGGVVPTDTINPPEGELLIPASDRERRGRRRVYHVGLPFVFAIHD